MKIKKVFGNYNLSIKKIVLFSIIAGLYTALMALIPTFKDTSFADITISFEAWILFGIFIIINSKSAKESALNCFLFFLISQPIVYLIQVPFASIGWGIFSYYKVWFVWTILTIPMGYIGYYIKKDKWWGLIILTPVLLFLGYHYSNFLRNMIFMFPRHLLSAIFCIITIIFYPIIFFNKKSNKIVGLIISVLIICVATIYSLINRITYTTDILVSGGSQEVIFDETYKVYLKDKKMGKVNIVFDDQAEDYLITAKFLHGGKTKLILEDNNKDKIIFNLSIYCNKYEIDKE